MLDDVMGHQAITFTSCTPCTAMKMPTAGTAEGDIDRLIYRYMYIDCQMYDIRHVHAVDQSSSVQVRFN